jgi:hypothetical protein
MSTLYEDGLIEVTDQEIVFRRYYFPSGAAKRVPLDQLERVEVRKPSFFGGSWRLWGTGNFRTWFPWDGARPSRDRIFIAYLRGSYLRIGFTVEHSQKVIEILKKRGLLQETS